MHKYRNLFLSFLSLVINYYDVTLKFSPVTGVPNNMLNVYTAPNIVPSLGRVFFFFFFFFFFSGSNPVYGCGVDFQASNVILSFGTAPSVTLWFPPFGHFLSWLQHQI